MATTTDWSKAKTIYTLRMRVTVDRPERRSHGLQTAHSTQVERKFRSVKDAVCMYEAVRAGEEDFGSEYVSSVELTRWTVDRPMATDTVVRRKIVRQRVVKVVDFSAGRASIRRLALEAERCQQPRRS